MNSYSVIGIVLSVAAALCLLAFLLAVKKSSKKTGYTISNKKVQFGKKFYTDLRDVYFVTEDFRCTVDSMLSKYPSGRVQNRLLAAQSYLVCSRYKDIETTLECYLKEEGEAYRITYEEIINNEEMKCRRLPLNSN